MSEDLKDIKSIALQMEIDGIKFYNDLAGKTLHPMGRAMFRSFVEDEKLHAKRLRALLSAGKQAIQTKGKDAVDSRQRLLTIFQEMGDELKKRVTVNTNDIEAVRLAIEIEEKGVVFYEQAAKETNDGKEKETYRFLAGEEKTHYSILKNTLEYLENTELWEAENEGRIYDMWTNIVNKKI
ncbi:MAG: ferritin family protein [Planctomycetota bacterium]|nr:ferritin family protein [Planctomycetota bacterium]MDE2216321.1 ferritin family protein [Planctomycetota bacterium]